jgi:hypothetical protein
VLPPTETAVTPEDKPVTETGVKESVVELFPNCPLSLAPQHFTAPDTTAHAWLLPTDIAVTPDDKPVTETGEKDCIVDPLPSCPLSFAPQHFAAPDNTTHVEFPPAEIELWMYELSELDAVSLASARAELVVSPKRPTIAMATTNKWRIK